MKKYLSILILLTVSIVFFKDTQAQAWVTRHDLSLEQYQKESAYHTSQGFRLTCLNGYSYNNQERFVAIWEKNQGSMVTASLGQTGAQFQKSFDLLSKVGLQLTSVSGYVIGNAVKFATIWEKASGNAWAARHNLSAAQFQMAIDHFQKQGYNLRHVSAYVINDVEYFSAIWEKISGIPWAVRYNMTAAQFQIALEDFYRQGYVLTKVSGYAKKDLNLYAGVWEKKSSQTSYMRYGVTKKNYQHVHDNMYFQGYKPVFLQGFAAASSSLFNGIWINPNFSSTDLAQINNAVNRYMNDQEVSGLSLAIVKSGRLVFAKGYGMANPNTHTEMSPNHSLRIWSISKPVTAVGIMVLIQQGHSQLLDSRVFGPNSILGAKYPTPKGREGLNSITVRQLLRMSSGLRTCNGEPPFHISTSTVATTMNNLMKAPNLISTLPDSEYIYSNANYFFLARVIEEVSRQPYEVYIRENVLNRCGIGKSMFVGRADGESEPGEVAYVPQAKPNMQLFDGFGGWVARPIDLLKFLRYVDGSNNPPDIINAATHKIMTTPSAVNNTYACGWMVSRDIQSHNGGYPGGYSFLVELPNELSYAVIVNSNSKSDPLGWTLKSVLDAALLRVTRYPSYNLF